MDRAGTLEVWGDYCLEITARIQNGTLYIGGRNGDVDADLGCTGYDLIYSDGDIAFSRMNRDCEYDIEFGTYEDDALAEGEWVTFAMEFVGETMSVSVDGEEAIISEDNMLLEGDLTMLFEADSPKGGTLDLAELRVTGLGDTTASMSGGLATMFVDGERVMTKVKTDTRSGSFGIGLTSTTPEARCEGRDIWVWTWE